MDESRRLLVSKDIPLSRVGRLKSLFQLGKPIPVEELTFDGSNADKEGECIDQKISSEAAVADAVALVCADAVAEQSRINTAVVAKRFRSAKAIFDQIEQASRKSVGQAKENAPPRRQATSPGGAKSPAASQKPNDASATKDGRQKPLVTRPKPVLSPEQLLALHQRSPKRNSVPPPPVPATEPAEQQNVSLAPSANDSAQVDVISSDTDNQGEHFLRISGRKIELQILCST